MDELLITEIGLLLTQLRYARRALEDIERSTAKYGGVTFAVALAAGPKFGEPPLVSGALKVFVTNINDLTVGRGAAGLFEGVLGGFGRFFGGLAGGFVGGIIGGLSLAVWIGKLQELVKGINEILDRLGIRGGSAAAAGASADADKGKGTGGTDWAATLERLNPMLQSLTNLFDAASSGPADAGKKAAESSSEDARLWGEQLATMLKAATTTLDALDKIIKGLTVFVPILIGALITLLVRLDDIKFAILDLLQFALRVALILRGAVLVTIYDTISAVAKLGASILEILRDAFKTILESVLSMISTIFSTLQAFISFAGSGLQKAMNAVLTWLVDGLGRVLTYLGELRVFRLLTHLVEVLPSMLPGLVTLVHGKDATISDEGMKWLSEIRGKSLAGPTGAALTHKVPKEIEFPNVGKEFLKDVEPFSKSLEQMSKELPDKTGKAFDAAKDGLVKIDQKMQDALTSGEATFNAKMTGDLANVAVQADKLSKVLTPAVDKAQGLSGQAEGDAGLRQIATAYQDWLKAGGLQSVVSQITAYFAGANAADPGSAAASVPRAAIDAARPDAPKATVEIGELIIELKAAKPEAAGKSPASRPTFLTNDGGSTGYDERFHRFGGLLHGT